ncbi:hypothetical protein ACJX0J_019071, partial [Zea mays]
FIYISLFNLAEHMIKLYAWHVILLTLIAAFRLHVVVGVVWKQFTQGSVPNFYTSGPRSCAGLWGWNVWDFHTYRNDVAYTHFALMISLG